VAAWVKGLVMRETSWADDQTGRSGERGPGV
jgi:hypothetical protein